jgi:hypothetical protein
MVDLNKRAHTYKTKVKDDAKENPDTVTIMNKSVPKNRDVFLLQSKQYKAKQNPFGIHL